MCVGGGWRDEDEGVMCFWHLKSNKHKERVLSMVLNGDLVNHCFLLGVWIPPPPKNLLTTKGGWKPQPAVFSSSALPTAYFVWTYTAWSLSTFVFSEEGGDKMHRVVVINIYFGSAPCSRTIKSASQNSFSSRPYLQTQLTSKGGQIPGKERWLN